jgi:hypothetical protein
VRSQYRYMLFDRYNGPPPISLTPQLKAEYGLRDEVIRKVASQVLFHAISEVLEQETLSRQELQVRREGNNLLLLPAVRI